MRQLYDFSLSGNCQKIRMMLAFLGLDYERVDIDLRKKDQMQASFLALNPLHKVPVLNDGGFIIRDSAAILVYLARQYGKEAWYPNEPKALGEIQQWLSLSVNEVFNGLAMARAMIIFKRPGDHDAAAALSRQVLDLLESRLQDQDWLALGRFTIADIACYPYTALVYEGHVPLEPYPAVRAWFKRIEALPGYAGMPGLPYPG